MIIDAYCRVRTVDQTIPDDVLDFMKDAAISLLNPVSQSVPTEEEITMYSKNYLIDGEIPVKAFINGAKWMRDLWLSSIKGEDTRKEYFDDNDNSIGFKKILPSNDMSRSEVIMYGDQCYEDGFRNALKAEQKKKDEYRVILDKYSEFLERGGYIDADWWTEQPDTISVFLNEFEIGEQKGREGK